MNKFSKLHPVLHLFFYLFSLLFALWLSNPFFSAVSLVCALLYLTVLKGKKVLKTLHLVFAAFVFISLFNMIFAHYGEDVLFKIRDTQFTLEALFYGFNQGLVLSSALLWFSALSFSADSERVIYLLRFAPKAALMFSMILGFIPRFSKKLSDIQDAQTALNGGKSNAGIKDKMKTAVHNLSALITYSLESSIITADSMSARGYNPKAVRASRFNFSAEDAVLLFIVIVLSAYVLFKKINGEILFIFEPKIYSESLSISALICFAALELIPFFAELWEEMLWKLSNVKV